MAMTFDDLCLDILIELFSYFNIHEIFYSFAQLIPCLPSLLVNGRVPLHIRSNNSYFIRWILPHIQLCQVVSLNVPKRPYNPSVFRFLGLRSLVIHDVDEPLKLLAKTHDWPPPSLQHLSLSIRNPDVPSRPSNIGTRVLEQALQLASLTSFELHESKSSLKMVELSDQLNLPSNFHSSTLQTLILTVYSNWKTLQSILSHTPHLRSLQFSSSTICPEKPVSSFSLLYLRRLHFQLDGLHTDLLKNLFRQAPRLRQIKLKCTVAPHLQSYRSLLQSETWRQLMDTSTPRLRILDVNLEFCLDGFDYRTIQTINEDVRKLNFEFDIDSENGYRSWRLIGIFNREPKI